MSKLIFIDLDDTLLKKDKKITDRNKSVIKRALDEGNIVSICSGRSIHGGLIAVRELGIVHDNLYQICYQGGLGRNVMSEEIFFRKPLSKEQAIPVMRAALDAGIFAIAFTELGIYVPSEGDVFERYIQITKEEHYVYDAPEDLYNRDINFYKILLADFSFSGRLERFRESFSEKERALKLNSFFSCREYLEYVPDNVDKGTGVKSLVSALGMDMKDTIAIGDERNDLAMIEVSNVGCAMNNAHEEVKKIADYITENDNEHSGVAEVIEKFVLKKA